MSNEDTITQLKQKIHRVSKMIKQGVGNKYEHRQTLRELDLVLKWHLADSERQKNGDRQQI